MLGTAREIGKNALDLPPAKLPPIVVDGRMLIERGTGVASYARGLHDALVAIGANPSILLDRRTLSGRHVSRIERWRRHVRAHFHHRRRTRPQASTEGEQWLVGRDIFREAQVYFHLHGRAMPVRLPGPPGIMHWCYPVPIFAPGWTNVYTLHDTIPLDEPELTSIDEAHFRQRLGAVIDHAAALVTVSEDARGAIRAWLGAGAPEVHNIGVALDLPAPAPGPLPRGSHFLHVGSIEPRKNLLRLAAAHAASGSARPLVLAGPVGWHGEAIRDELARYPGVQMLPWLDRAALVGLMRDARAMLFPSLAEGFGLPVAEGFALGVPVLTANRRALAEVAGDAAITVDPEDETAIADGIARLDRDDALCARLIAQGRERAEAFTPARFAERLGAVYAELAAGGGRKKCGSE